jgi:hypothetical protein
MSNGIFEVVGQAAQAYNVILFLKTLYVFIFRVIKKTSILYEKPSLSQASSQLTPTVNTNQFHWQSI